MNFGLLREKVNTPIKFGDPSSYAGEQYSTTHIPWTKSLTTYDENKESNYQLVVETGPNGTTSYFYDVNGNLVEKSGPDGVTTYDYDYENRLTDVTTPSHVVSYEYDPDGMRIAKVVDGNKTEYVLDSQRPYAEILEERNENGDLLARYTYGNDLISRHGAEGTLYYHKSKIGSTVHVTNASETVVGTFDYDAWGKETYAGGQFVGSVMHRYAGQYYDIETGLYYMRARYYDPRVGRFIGRDAFGGDENNPISLNKYLYADGNPVMWTDPSGLYTLKELSVTIAVSGVLAAVAIPLVSHMTGTASGSKVRVKLITLKFFGFSNYVGNVLAYVSYAEQVYKRFGIEILYLGHRDVDEYWTKRTLMGTNADVIADSTRIKQRAVFLFPHLYQGAIIGVFAERVRDLQFYPGIAVAAHKQAFVGADASAISVFAHELGHLFGEHDLRSSNDSHNLMYFMEPSNANLWLDADQAKRMRMYIKMNY